MFDYIRSEGKQKVDRCSTVLVVSPLTSLMIEQTRNLNLKGVAAAILVSKSTMSNVPENLRATEKYLTSETYSFLYTSPEAIITVSKWRDIILHQYSQKVVTIAVDEAHCASQWYG